MVDQTLFTQTLSEFARTLVADYDISDVLYALADRVADVIGVDAAGVALADEADQLRFVAASPGHVAALERLQERLQAGPCVDAFRRGEVVAVTDLKDDGDRWPEFNEEAAQVGVRSTAAIPLGLADSRLGALNLYHSEPRAWSDVELSVANVLGTLATSYLLNASKLARAERTAEQLERALESRVVIEQAKGVVATQRGITVDQAFDLLRRHARRHGATVQAVADAVVNLGLQL